MSDPTKRMSPGPTWTALQAEIDSDPDIDELQDDADEGIGLTAGTSASAYTRPNVRRNMPPPLEPVTPKRVKPKSPDPPQTQTPVSNLLIDISLMHMASGGKRKRAEENGISPTTNDKNREADCSGSISSPVDANRSGYVPDTPPALRHQCLEGTDTRTLSAAKYLDSLQKLMNKNKFGASTTASTPGRSGSKKQARATGLPSPPCSPQVSVRPTAQPIPFRDLKLLAPKKSPASASKTAHNFNPLKPPTDANVAPQAADTPRRPRPRPRRRVRPCTPPDSPSVTAPRSSSAAAPSTSSATALSSASASAPSSSSAAALPSSPDDVFGPGTAPPLSPPSGFLSTILALRNAARGEGAQQPQSEPRKQRKAKGEHADIDLSIILALRNAARGEGAQEPQSEPRKRRKAKVEHVDIDLSFDTDEERPAPGGTEEDPIVLD